VVPANALWLAIEGVAGLQPQLDGVAVNPSMPGAWRWLVCQRVPRGNSFLTFIYLDGVIHASQPLTSSLPVEVYDRIESARTEAPAFILERGDRRWVFACAPGEGWSDTVRADKHTVRVSLDGGEARLIAVE
jgi:hypothetical protein